MKASTKGRLTNLKARVGTENRNISWSLNKEQFFTQKKPYHVAKKLPLLHPSKRQVVYFIKILNQTGCRNQVCTGVVSYHKEMKWRFTFWTVDLTSLPQNRDQSSRRLGDSSIGNPTQEKRPVIIQSPCAKTCS